MSTLVFDIETVGTPWSALDALTQQVLTKWIDGDTSLTEDERALKTKEVKEGLGLSPFTGKVISLALYDIERSQGAVYYVADEEHTDEWEGEFVFKVRTEAELLQDFWDGAHAYDTFVTFHGRMFDAPFLLHRSAINEVQPTVNLMSHRYLERQTVTKHIDLADQFSFYGAMSRRPNLHLLCQAHGIVSPKADGVSGEDVAKLFLEKQFRDIARYNAADAMATKRLYEVWQQYFDFRPEVLDL